MIPEGLRDIHLPPPPSAWPPSWPVLLLSALLLALVFAALWGRRRRWRSTQRRREALAELDQLITCQHDSALYCSGVSMLLRRATRYRDPQAATLPPAQWLAWLQREAPLDEDAACLLAEAPYRPTQPLPATVGNALHTFARRCLERLC